MIDLPHDLSSTSYAGQLEQELVDDSWLMVPAGQGLLFDLPLDQRWQAAAGSIGVDLVNYASHDREILVHFILNHVNDVIMGNAPYQAIKIIDNRYVHKVISSNQINYFFLVGFCVY